MTYYLYEETVDDATGESVERLHGLSADTFAYARTMLDDNPRYQGIDYWDGLNWHYDVRTEIILEK